MKKILWGLGVLALLVGAGMLTRFVVAENIYGEATVLNEAPLVISSDPSVEVLTPTDTVDVVYTIENPGDGPGDVAITLTDFVPSWGKLIHDPFGSVSNFSYDSEEDSATFSLEKGEKTLVSFSYRVLDPALAPQVLSYGLSARYSYPDSDESSLEYTTILQYTSSLALVGNALDIGLVAQASSSTVSPGDTVAFTYVVTNNEPIALSSEAAILAKLPEQFTYTSHTVNTTSTATDTSYDLEEGVLSIHDLLPGGVVTLTVKAVYEGTATGDEIVQDAYVTHTYLFALEKDAAVDFAVVDSAQIRITPAENTLPYQASGLVLQDTFQGGDEITLSYTFTPTRPKNISDPDFDNAFFAVQIPSDMAPARIEASSRPMVIDGKDSWMSDVVTPFTENDSSWIFDEATRELIWRGIGDQFFNEDEGFYSEFTFVIHVKTGENITDTAFAFPGELRLYTDEEPEVPAQIFSATPSITRGVLVTVPEPTPQPYVPPTSSGGGSSSSGGSSSGSSGSSGSGSSSSGSSSGGSSSGSSSSGSGSSSSGSSSSGSSSSSGGGGGGGGGRRGTSSSGEQLTYAVYIVNPDGSIRSSESSYAGYSLKDNDEYGIVMFDDSGEDMDRNDVVVKVDSRDCDAAVFSVQEVNASWKHQVGVAVFKGTTQIGNYILFKNDHASIGSAQELDLESLLGKGKTCSSAKVLHTKAIKNGGCVQTCDTLATEYYLSILNPDGTRRETFTPFVEIGRKGNRQFTLNFEDGGDGDFNDVVLGLDVANCRDMQVSGLSIDASWHHAVYGTMYYNGVLVSDNLIAGDSHALMGKTVRVDANDDLVMCIAE